MGTLAAFARHQIHDLQMPKVKWQHEGANPVMGLKVQADPPPKAARLWSAQAPTRDFRQAKWTERPVDAKNLAAELPAPEKGYVVFLAELEYEIEGQRYFLSTQLRVAGKDAQ